MQLFDCTLRDGGNVLGNGFPGDLTVMMLQGLLDNNITRIEFGNAYGIGAYEADGKTAPLTDREYLDLAQPFLPRGEIGMFVGVKNAVEKNIALAASKGMKFLRIGANAGDGDAAKSGIALIRKYNMFPRYSLMKGYILSAKDLAEEAKKLEDWGLGAITIMDSAGTMTPGEVSEYVEELAKTLSIPIGFHGHNNLGLSAANALAAEKSGAVDLDCGLLGMARSAGNLPTELAAALFQRNRKLKEINLLGLLEFIDTKLAPAMAKHNYKAAVCPQDLVLGFAGCHSNFLGLFKETAAAEKVNLYQLIIEVSKKNRKNPSKDDMIKIARELK
jgi:4-hydroxy-2-oxovalerate aldolase